MNPILNIKPPVVIPVAVCILLLMAGCSTEKNTAGSRWWHSFNARYNTYYNGKVAYIEGSLEKESGHKDNFTELLPLYTVGNKNSASLGKAGFDKAIEKAEKAIKQHSIKRRPVWKKNGRKTERDIEWLGRKEYNPFLWKAWMLMGRAQFHQGDFDAASSTFNYMARLYETQPAIYGRARAWLAKCYVENDFLYDAEDVIRNMRRDSIHWRAQKEWDYTLADYYIHAEQYEEAIPYLKKVIKHEMRKKQKAREYFLLGQLLTMLGRHQEAYDAYQKVIRQNPPYELEFNARIAQTEVMSSGQSGKMIAKLKRMAASDKNKDYLDQVYYAIGNIYLAQNDTLHAISNYEQGNSKATRSGIEKGVLLLKLGNLYWEREKYNDARRCYGEAIGLLDKDRKDYELLSQRSKVLDALVPFTDAVQLQDSLQTLAKMSENDRNAAIDRVITALKKKEKEEQKRLAEENAEQVIQRNRNTDTMPSIPFPPVAGTQQRNGEWYFYNPMAVQQGKQLFRRMWGKRDNTDNWQRANTTVVEGLGNVDSMSSLSDMQRDSTNVTGEDVIDNESAGDSVQNDPHNREFYLAQIPFTEEQLEASNDIIMEGLYNSGVIFKEKLDNLSLSEKVFRRLIEQYPGFTKKDEAYYHLFLLYSRKGEPQLAEGYINKLRNEYPKSRWTQLLTDPYFTQNARYGVHIEDSLYAATYNAFKADRFAEVKTNAQIAEKRFPLGANRDKFLFVGGLSKLNSGDGAGCLGDMKTLVERYPDSRLAEMAGMIINGVKEGRRLHGGKFDLGDVWARRSVVLSDSDSIKARTLSNERNTNFVFMLVYKPDSVDQNILLFEIARYNFTSYLVRDFNIAIEKGDGIHRMVVSGFRNFDEALQYARQLLRQQAVVRQMGKSRPIIISEENLPLLGTNFSYDEYGKFYTKHFAPLSISTFRLLTEPAGITIKPSKQNQPPVTERDIDDFLNNTIIVPDELSVPAETIVPIEEEPATKGANIPPGSTVVPADSVPTSQPGTTIIPTEEPSAAPIGTTVVPLDGKLEPKPAAPKSANGTRGERPGSKTPAMRPTLPAAPVQRTKANILNGAEIIFDNPDTIPPGKARPKNTPGRADKKNHSSKTDGKRTTNGKKTPDSSKSGQNNRSTFDPEDEYYELEGF